MLGHRALFGNFHTRIMPPGAVPSPALQKAVKHLLDHRATQFLPVFPARPVRPMRCT